MKSTATCCPKHCFYSTTHRNWRHWAAWTDSCEWKFISLNISRSAQPKIILFFTINPILNYGGSPSIHLYSRILVINRSPSRSVTSRFLCMTHGCQGCTNTKQRARKQTRRDQYARLIKQWHKQSCWILLLVICWCIWISPSLKE